LGPISLKGTVAVWIYLSVFFGVWGLASPLMSVPDEPAHTVKAASVWFGQLRGTRTQVEGTEQQSGSGMVPVDEVRVPEAFASTLRMPSCYAFYAPQPVNCAPDMVDSDRLVTASTTAAPAPPWYYLIVGWPARLIQNDGGAFLMRLVSLSAGAMLIALAVRSLSRFAGLRLAVMGTALAMTPMVPFLVAAVNPAGFEIAGAILWWSASAALVLEWTPGRRPDTGLVVEFYLGFAVVALTRGLGPLYVGLAALVILAFVGWRSVRALLDDRHFWRLVPGLVVIAALGAAWVLSSGQFDAVPGSPLAEGERPILVLLGATDDFIRQMIAIFGWKDTGPIQPAVFAWLAAIGLLLGAVTVLADRHRRVVVLAACGAVAFLPVVLQAPIVERDGIAWQGRYILPFAVGVPVLAVVAIARFGRPAAPRGAGEASSLRALATVTLSLWAIAQWFSLYAWLHRTTVGMDPDRLNPFAWGDWTPPIPAGVLLIMGLLAVLVPALVARLLPHSEGRDQESPDLTAATT
jgi:hypothetical protein